MTHKNYAQIMIWMICALLLMYLGPRSWSYAHLLIWALSNTAIYAICCNLNLILFFPQFLKNGSFLIYLGSLLGTCLIFAPLQSLINQYFCNHESEHCMDWITDQRFHFISLFVTTSISTLARIPLDWINAQQEKQSLQTKNIEAELNYLKNQINPHFLFNTLNNLYALSLKKSDRAPDLILKLSDMLRYMLYECNEEQVLLDKEIHYIKNYIELEKIRLSQNADIRIEINGDTTRCKVAPLIFIPFIENSFKHGLKNGNQESFIHIKFTVNNNISFSICNSKSQIIPGFRQSQNIGGIGLTNVQKRLMLIYQENYVLKVINQPDTYTINLTINQKDQIKI
ncbi:MAG: sensor histidine kinase [Saprospiraceae bacterium]|nr:sensor histidine kinase [Saprospiraceae bacterium]